MIDFTKCPAWYLIILCIAFLIYDFMNWINRKK